MQRSFLFAIILVLAAVIGGIFLLNQDDPAPPPPPSIADGPETGGIQPVSTGTMSASDRATDGAAVREAVAGGMGDLMSDPDIRAGLCGFKGRVITHRKEPVVDCGVRIYRGAMDSILPMRSDLFDEEPADFEPQYIAGEVRTKDDGTFLMTGVWPRGFYIMFAGLDTDAPTHQLITDTPSPGEIVDLGDVMLNDSGVITGTVYDDEGEPLAGALVRAADIPGAYAAFVPLERFDPEGALLVRERGLPVSVVQFPTWVKHAFEHVPIPTTRSAADGTFRLVGCMPGSNMLATTHPDYMSNVKPSVKVRAGAERNVGKIRMRLGEELYAQVIDQKGKPVPGAEVLAGSTVSMIPVDFAQDLGKADDEGRVSATGFSSGKVTVAARRSSKDPWVIAEPQNIFNDVFVTLPATFEATVSVVMADGSPAKEPRLKLLRGRKGRGAAEMYMLGMSKPIDLEGRMTELEGGGWKVSNLLAGEYTMLAEVTGSAVGAESFEVGEADASVAIQLETPRVFEIMVVDQNEQPIRNAAIFAEGRGNRVIEMPINCGRTDEEGRVTIDKIQADRLRVSADHPRFGVVHGETKNEDETELVLKMLEPGSISGTLVENGKPPVPGKFTVAVLLQRVSGARGPLEQVPSMITANADGQFQVGALQPGRYYVAAVDSLDTIRSPGSIFSLAQNMFLGGRMPDERVEVSSGQVTQVTLECGKEPLEGPTAQLTGSVTIDGRVAAGYSVTAYANGRRFGARIDDRGRFDLGIISAGSVWVSVMGGEEGIFVGPGSNVYTDTVELKEGELRELTIDILTSSISGNVYLADGTPAANAHVQGQGVLSERGRGGRVWKHTSTNSEGFFQFRGVPEGTWKVKVESGDGEEQFEGVVEDIEVVGGTPIEGMRIQMRSKLVVSGRVEMTALANNRRWSYLEFRRLKEGDAPDARGRRAATETVDRESGAFVSDELSAGRYRVTLHTSLDNEQRALSCGELNVPADGLKDVVLVPQL